MKSNTLAIVSFFTAAIVTATAASATSGEQHNYPQPGIDAFLSASRNMQNAIVNDDEIFKKLDLDSSKLEIMMPDEQFQTICDAIRAYYSDVIDQNSAKEEEFRDAEHIFGKENADAIWPMLGNREKIENVRRQYREAYEVFANYHSTQEATSAVSDWNWGESWGVFINPSLGTLGIGIDVGYEFNRHFKIRAHYGSGSISHNGTLSDATYQTKWENNNNYGILLDWHPRGSQFRVSAGVLVSDPRIKVDTNYHGTTYAYNRTLDGISRYDVYSDYSLRGKWRNNVQPYLGIGWSSDGSGARTLFFSVDIGVAYMGDGNYADNGEATFWIDGTHVHRGDPGWQANSDAMATLEQFDANVRDVVDKVGGILNDMQVYPVLQFGGGIRF